MPKANPPTISPPYLKAVRIIKEAIIPKGITKMVAVRKHTPKSFKKFELNKALEKMENEKPILRTAKVKRTNE